MNEEKPHYIGHRKRLRDKFLKSGPESLSDYELLELLLMTAIPRRDVKPLAKDLLNKFKTFANVIYAAPKELEKVNGVKETTISALKIVEASIKKVLKDEVKEQSVIWSWNKLIEYCQVNISHEKIEQFHILYLDTKQKLIDDEVIATGTIDSATVYPREIVKKVLDKSAAAVILVHNHPSGDPMPSKADIDMTKKVRDALQTVGIILHDHVIIGKGTYASFRVMGLL
jgi:DNA repair protein RadC